MPIFQAIGFGLLIVISKILIPDVLSEGEKTAIVFLQGVQAGAQTLTASADGVGRERNSPSLPPFPLPRAPQVVSTQHINR